MEQSETDLLKEKLQDAWNRILVRPGSEPDDPNSKAICLLAVVGEVGPMVELLISEHPIDPWTRINLAEMLLGVSPLGNKLEVTRRRGRGRPSGTDTDTLHIGQEAETRIAKGQKAKEADAYVANLFRVSEHTVRKARQQWREFLRDAIAKSTSTIRRFVRTSPGLSSAACDIERAVTIEIERRFHSEPI